MSKERILIIVNTSNYLPLFPSVNALNFKRKMCTNHCTKAILSINI